jgi:hypothetical protein
MPRFSEGSPISVIVRDIPARRKAKRGRQLRRPLGFGVRTNQRSLSFNPTPALLANILRRHPRRYDHRARRQPARYRAMGVALRLLSGLASGRPPERHRRDLRRGPGPILRAHGRSFCQSAPRPIFGRGAIIGIGPRENMRSGMQAKNWNTCADDLASRTAKGASWFDQRSDLGICR